MRQNFLTKMYDGQSEVSGYSQPHEVKVPPFNSDYLISGSKERFKELEEKGHDWRSFYSGWLEGRVKMWEDYREDINEASPFPDQIIKWLKEEFVKIDNPNNMRLRFDIAAKFIYDYWYENIYPGVIEQSKK